MSEMESLVPVATKGASEPSAAPLHGRGGGAGRLSVARDSSIGQKARGGVRLITWKGPEVRGKAVKTSARESGGEEKEGERGGEAGGRARAGGRPSFSAESRRRRSEL